MSLRQNYLLAPLSGSGLAEADAIPESAEEFAAELAFGTGGMRAITGHGTNRLNSANIARISIALGRYTVRYHSDPLFVIAYDSRLTSDRFSRVTASILSGFGRIRIFSRPTPTPLLSFAVRELGAAAGVVITASHNPPAYNGYKVYGPDGGQIVSPTDSDIENLYLSIGYDELPRDLTERESRNPAEAELIGDEILQAYTKRLLNEPFFGRDEQAREARSRLRVAYSALHGTGSHTFKSVFTKAGYTDFALVPAQSEPDGHFPTVKSPNPEEAEAFRLAIEYSGENPRDLLIASDPDADRVGVVAIHNGQPVYLTGNQTGALLLQSMISNRTFSPDHFIAKTIVTSELQSLIAEANGIRVIETLTGFKHIAAAIAADPEHYVFGGEESYGYLPVNWVRDKDSVSSALAICELAIRSSLPEALDDLHSEFGVFHELLHNLSLTGAPEIMDKVCSRIREPRTLFDAEIAGEAVTDILDLQEGSAPPVTDKAITLHKSLEPGMVVQWWLSNRGRVTIRPSGTEPKIKIYVSINAGRPGRESLAQLRESAAQRARKVLDTFLSRLLE